MRDVSQRSALVVDDDPVIRLVAADALRALDYEVEEVESGAECLERVAARRPDLILLDVEMPGMNGFETCRALRSRPDGDAIAILIATGHTDPETIDAAFQAGATDFIKKPLDWQLLQHRVRFLARAQDAFGDLRSTLEELHRSQESLNAAQEMARIGSWELDLEEEQLLWSSELGRIIGLEARAGLRYDDLIARVHPDDRAGVEKTLRSATEEVRPFSLDHRIVTSQGIERFVYHRGQVFAGPDGSAERIAGTLQDVTERHEAEQQIRHLAYYDGLTGLPNRRMMLEQLEHILRASPDGNAGVALLLVDLDRFKRINDTLGHEVGDGLIRALAKRLLRCVRGTDHVARFGRDTGRSVMRLAGDEFTILLRQVAEPDDARWVADRVLQAMREPFRIDEHRISMSGSVGISVNPRDGSDAQTLLRCADTAIHHAKREGGNCFHFFDRSMSERAMRNLALEDGMRRALESGEELFLCYQPQVDAASGETVAVEALARWSSPVHGSVGPDEFIPLAEETGQILELGEWVLRTACAEAQRWVAEGLPRIRLSVNVSSRQVQQPGLVSLVEQVLADTGFPADFLELEITETALLGRSKDVVENLRAIRALGIGVSLDDFGTGYSSLSHLIDFPIDSLKIDRAFVRGIAEHDRSRAIASAVIAMAHRLGLGVIGEGVETEQEADLLRNEGCDLFQGYWISRPVPADELKSFLRARR